MALKGCNGTDEDILTYAMFPQVAPKFFAQRAEGPKNVSKTAATTAASADTAKPVDAAAKPAEGKGPITSPVTYEIRVGEKSHKVTVQPA